MFEEVKKKLNILIHLNQSDLFRLAMSQQYIQDEIINMITNDQLYDKGIDGDGASLGVYSDYTKEYKKFKGERYDHVTLFDEGDFYKSFKIELKGLIAEVKANTIKTDEKGVKKDLLDVYGDAILELTKENLEKLCEMVAEFIRGEIRRRLLSVN
jgi:hypothetical protein